MNEAISPRLSRLFLNITLLLYSFELRTQTLNILALGTASANAWRCYELAPRAELLEGYWEGDFTVFVYH